MEAVDTCISELNGIDPKASVFRYPEYADAERLNHQIDLGNLKSVMGRLGAFLDALNDYWADCK